METASGLTSVATDRFRQLKLCSCANFVNVEVGGKLQCFSIANDVGVKALEQPTAGQRCDTKTCTYQEVRVKSEKKTVDRKWL